MPTGVPISVASSDITHAAEDRVGQAAVAARRRRHLGEQRQRRAPANPCANSVHRIHTSQNRPNSTSSQRQHQTDDIDDAPAAIEDCVRPCDRLGSCALAPWRAGSSSILRQRQHDERDQEQDQSEFDQRGGVQIAHRFGEFVGERRRRCCCPGQTATSLIRWALPMTKVTAMVSPSARPRPSMMPPTTPILVYGSTTFQTTSQVVAPRRVGRLLQHRRHHFEHVAHDRGDERDHHDRQDDAGGKHADAHAAGPGTAGREPAGAECVDQPPAGRSRAKNGANTNRPHMP